MKKSTKLSKVGPYIIMETIGVGSFAKVKLCVHHHTLDRYACKVIEKSLIRQRLQNAQVQREVAIMSRLRHRNTVSLVSVHSTATRIFIVMELVTGGELFDQMCRFRRLKEPQARFYFRQLIHGICYCHSRGVFHRDLKPDNLLVGPNFTLKITDFGLSALKTGAEDSCDSFTTTLKLHTQCGTPNYVAPEIIKIKKSGYSGAKADAWACGVILYILVGGGLPFDAENLGELFESIVNCNQIYPPSFSDSLKDLIDKLLTSNPDKRYSLDQVQKHPWYNEPEERPTGPFRPRIPAVSRMFNSGSELEISPVYPLPDERERVENKKSLAPQDAALENVRKGLGSDSKDSLDFGTRVETVPSGLTVSALPKAYKASKRHLGSLFVGSPLMRKGKQHGGEPSNSPAGAERNSGGSCDDSESCADEGWALNETDRLMWCRMMKDFDMVPDAFEFGMDIATLSAKWQQGLAKEELHKRNSFATSRFGSQREPEAPSSERVTPNIGHADAMKRQDYRNFEHSWDDVPVWSQKSKPNVNTLTKEGILLDQGQHVIVGDELNHRESGVPEEVASEHANDTEEVQKTETTLIDRLPPSERPKSLLQPSNDAGISGDDPSSDADANSNTSSAVANSAYTMGEGQDLLEENETRESVVEFSTPPGNDLDADLPVSSLSESEGVVNAPEENLDLTASTASPLPETESSPAENSATIIVAPGNDWRSLSPFAIDVPGPRRGLPSSRNIFSSIVPKTVSPRRLFSKKASPHEIKSFTQFHSLLDPSACFDVIHSVLQEYGCTVVKTSASRSRQKFQIRCDSRKGDVMVHAQLNIYRLDDVLSTVIFKKLLHTDVKDFMRFYADITRSYSEALKARGISERAKEGLATEDNFPG